MYALIFALIALSFAALVFGPSRERREAKPIRYRRRSIADPMGGLLTLAFFAFLGYLYFTHSMDIRVATTVEVADEADRPIDSLDQEDVFVLQP